MDQQQDTRKIWKLTLGALGVVFGDIGTSPLYALKESLSPGHGIPPTEEGVLGILSLVFWLLTIVVSIKYLALILRADNHGEGGITALLALLLNRFTGPEAKRSRQMVSWLGIFGAGLLFGDAIFTPAISTLSAVEGLGVATPAFEPYIVPITISILVLLFAFQRQGTSSLAAVFGPITLLWFVVLFCTGLPWIYKHPSVLMALNPVHGILFLFTHGLQGFLVLGAVVLCVTGVEALYADMGHFGKTPIRRAWAFIVGPSLVVNYFGQGALVLERGQEVLSNPFYALVSGTWQLYFLVGLATLATIIASQALITGAYSLAQQTIQLGYLPRMTISHTSRSTEGQIYVPRINVLLAIACIALVVIYKSSSALAGAYGIAVTGTMVTTSLLMFAVMRYIWKWNLILSSVIFLVIVIIDLTLFSANLVKFFHGGWIPIAVALTLFSIMMTWKRGRLLLAENLSKVAVPLDEFFDRLDEIGPVRVQGTAVFMTLSKDIAPSVLLHHFRHNQILHEQVILLSIQSEHTPEVAQQDRVRLTELPGGFYKIVARYGYMETPDVQKILRIAESKGLVIDTERLSYFLGRETFLTKGNTGMAHWRKRLFIFLSRNARPATEFFNLPADRVIEIGSQIHI